MLNSYYIDKNTKKQLDKGDYPAAFTYINLVSKCSSSMLI